MIIMFGSNPKYFGVFKSTQKTFKVFPKDGIFTISSGNPKSFGAFTIVPAGFFFFPIL
jgi:hypothetical protein